jgi:DNA invertase Pin-like site-specific DNA recombinase
MSPHQGKWVAYYRVSTQQQGHSGLGLDAQRASVRGFLDGGRWQLISEFTEIESGKVNTRPELAKALALCKATRSRLVIAKLDRLSRNAAFLLQLRDAGVRFVAADMPEATDTVIGIMAVIAQDERERISQRTRDAFKAVRAELAAKGFRVSRAGRRYTRLGNPHGAAYLKAAGKGNVAAVQAIRAAADQQAQELAPILADIEKAGITSHRGIAAELNAREIPSPRGKLWNEFQVARLRRRLQALDHTQGT